MIPQSILMNFLGQDMAGTLIAIASGPAILCLYLTCKARMPEAFPHWVFISNGFFCYLLVLVTFVGGD